MELSQVKNLFKMPESLDQYQQAMYPSYNLNCGKMSQTPIYPQALL